MLHLEPLPDQAPIRVLYGGCVRKPAALLRKHLASLDAQLLPPRVVLTPCFVDDNVDPESSALLKAYCTEHHKGIYFDARAQHTPAFADNHPLTHQWSGDAMQRVGEMKNGIIREAMEGAYDALWLIDSDLLCSPRTLWSLWYADAPIVCGVFWTRWMNIPDCPVQPQVWLRQPYGLDGRGMTQADFFHDLMTRQRLQVWGQGACTLYRVPVFRKGLSFDRLPDLPIEGMWQGEDRHLCVRAERLHLPMLADAWPDIFHVYHPQDHDRVIEWPIETEHPTPADLVSLRLRAVEPIPVGPNQMAVGQPQHVRGVLGKLPLAPELEQAIPTMTRGDTRIISVTYPMWSKSSFRGTKRLIEVMLVDHKPNAAPVNT